MKVLIACEFSGRVREAFNKKGHEAWSCDLLPTEISGLHWQGDVFEIINEQHWDMMIGFPPCTYLTRAGSRWWKTGKWVINQPKALDFVRLLMNANIEKIVIENPPGAIGTNIRKADQYIQPWEHGHTEKKMTGLWLKNLPKLKPSKIVKKEMNLLPEKLKSKCHYAAPGPDRWKNRSRILQGIADAMADQWGYK